MAIINDGYELVLVESLSQHPANPRRGDVGAIQESIDANGFYGACIAQRSTGRILAGNHRYLAAKAEGLAELPVIWVDCDDDAALRILLADNRTNDKAGYDDAALVAVLSELANTVGLRGTGYGDEDLEALLASLAEPPEPRASGSLSERFGVPPFSVLNAREGWWQSRKQAWLSLGIESEIGRGGG